MLQVHGEEKGGGEGEGGEGTYDLTYFLTIGLVSQEIRDAAHRVFARPGRGRGAQLRHAACDMEYDTSSETSKRNIGF